jgi:hypothetical protein
MLGNVDEKTGPLEYQRAGGNPLQCYGVKKRRGRESIRKHDIEMRLPWIGLVFL